MSKKNNQETGGPKAPSLSDIKASARESFGDELIKTLNEKPLKNINGLSWGAPSLNYICTGNPFVGIVPGRIYEIFGKESSGKTTLCLHALAQAQAAKVNCAFVDAEHALDVTYAGNLGVDADKLLFVQPDYGEQALDVVERFVELGVRLIVVDSVSSLVPLDELEANMEKAHMGLQARMMSKAMRKLAPKVAKSQSAILFINQTREKIGVVFGNPETTTGGNALKFYSSFRLRCTLSVAKDKSIKGASGTLLGKKELERLGAQMSIKMPKNKLFRPFLDCEIPLYYGLGLDIVKDWYEFAAANEIIIKGRGAYTIPGKTQKQSRRIVTSKLSEHVGEIQDLVRRKF